ncbi:MAG: M3 family metallopeptidase [Bacteroidales bacterium]
MRNLLIGIATTCIMTTACTEKKTDQNPFFTQWNTPYGIPPFELIQIDDYMPAFDAGIKQHAAEIDSIASQDTKPTFQNTIEPLEYSGKLLSRVSNVFFNITSAETNDSLQSLARDIMPALSEHDDNMYLNEKLFKRVKTIYENQDTENLTSEQKRVLDNYYKNFVRSGALLTDAQKEEMKEINKELSVLTLQFEENVLAEKNSFALVIDKEEDLAGLPADLISAAAEDAKSRNLEGKWVITLQNPSWIPFLQYSDKRDLRETVYKAYINRANNGNKFDNNQIINKITNLRIRKANLLGYPTYADFVLDDTMAKTPANVMALLNKLWNKAVPKAKEEVIEMQMIADNENANIQIQPWDWWYYAEKVRKAKYDLNEEEIKPYFQVENVRDGAFMVANKLWGITFEEITDAPVYNNEVKAFKVNDSNGELLSILLVDYFPRAGKQGGAWMSNYREQFKENGKNIRPIVVNVGNFTRPTGDKPSLLTLDEVETLFHEFGHALHGMLANSTYPSVSGTNVSRDFVELPSQIMEHWATHPEVLKMYAKHYATGDTISDVLIEKINKAATFNQGFTTTELVAAAILDMKWHTISQTQQFDPQAFEAQTIKEIGLIPEIAPRYRSTYFNHIFSGGYSAGYYSYLWAEVLDADAFDAFAEKGIFNQEVAKAYRENILEKGDSEEPMTLYLKFRGAEPNPDALLRNRGLN